MKRRLWLIIFALTLAIIAAWLWWMKPTRVDMAAYAPADALLYLESDSPVSIMETVTETGAWKAFERATDTPHSSGSNRLQTLIRWTGLGPVQSVVLSRAQIAVVVTDLGATEAGDTLKVKSEGAILIETHTSEWRTKTAFEELLKSFAEKLYGKPTQQKIIEDGLELIEWKSHDGSRRIVGASAGSLLIIGTSQTVVKNCLAVSQGQRPALKADAELSRLRRELKSNSALTFGYVPAANSSKLLTFGIPLLLGRAPGDSDFQRLISTGASKVFGSLGWSSRAYASGIEDRYLISLQPAVIDRLKPGFTANASNSQIRTLAPDTVYSVTSYRLNDPEAAWQGLKAAVSSQVDALSAIVFASLLKSSLLSYGIEEPETFLAATKGEVLTLRFDETSERSILIAGVENRVMLHELLRKTMSSQPRNNNQDVFEDQAGEYGAALTDNFVVMGSPADVRRYLEFREAGGQQSDVKFRQLTEFQSGSGGAAVSTITNDERRVQDFFAALQAARNIPMGSSARFEKEISTLPFSVTESVLGPNGIERTTRSPLGQFSTLLPLLFPDQPVTNTGRN